MSTKFLRRVEGAPLQLDPRQPHRGFLSVVKDSAHKQGILIDWKPESGGPHDKPLWKVTPIIMGEVHDRYTRSALTIQKAKEASAAMIAASGRL